MKILFAMTALTALAAGPRPQTAAPDYVAVLVARSFLRALADRDLRQAVTLSGDKVDFDGHMASGRIHIRKRMAALVRRFPVGFRFRSVVFMSYQSAVRRFGPPPKRLASNRLQGSVVAFGRLPHMGLVVFIKKIKGRWQVVALSD